VSAHEQPAQAEALVVVDVDVSVVPAKLIGAMA